MKTAWYEIHLSHAGLCICISYFYNYDFIGPFDSRDFTNSVMPKDA